MKVEKSELLEALAKIRPALSEKGIIEQTDHFIFDGRQGFVRTYNDEISISLPFKSDFSAAIKAEEFFGLISKIEAEQIVLTLKDGAISITAGRMRGEMVTATEIKCPAVEIKIGRWKPLPKRFVEAVRFCSFSAERSVLIAVLACLWIKDGCVFSSDNYRATKYELDAELPEFLLPAGAARELAKYEPVHYAIDAGAAWIHFRNGEGVIFSSRVVEGVYPDEVRGLFTLKGDEVVIPEGLKNAAECGRIFSQEMLAEKGDLIQIKVDKSGKMVCRGAGLLGYAEQEFRIDYKKRDFELMVPPDSLIEILLYAKTMRVSDDKLYFSGPSFEHVISLI